MSNPGNSAVHPPSVRREALRWLVFLVAGVVASALLWPAAALVVSRYKLPDDFSTYGFAAIVAFLMISGAVREQWAYRAGRRDEAEGKDWRRGYFLR